MGDVARILIADDEETFLHSTADLLRTDGYECDCVSNADAVVESLAGRSYDLLIVDIKMPGNANLELVRALQGTNGRLPIILVTGYPSFQSAHEAIGLTVIAYLVKPFDYKDLRVEVDRGISWSRLSRTVGAARHRIDGWKHELTSVEGVLGTGSQDSQTRSLEAFLGLTLRNIAGSLDDLRRVAQASRGQAIVPEACHLLNCPRHARLLESLEDAISVLEHTRSSFKSKELGDLRRRLEMLLDEERGG